MKAVKSIVSLLGVALLLVFVLQNSEVLSTPVSLTLDLFMKDFSPGPLPLYVLLFLIFFLGLIISGTVALLDRLRSRAQLRRLNRALTEKERELNSLRNLPVLESPGQDKMESPLLGREPTAGEP
jgi:putative membrane protein